MRKTKIPTLALIAFATTLSVGCSKKEEKPQEVAPEVKEDVKEEKEIAVTNIEKASFANISELRNFSKKSTSDFSKFLTNNKIENVLSSDGSLVTIKNMTYEKYTKDFNQLAYTHISTNYNDGTGYLKSGIKLNFHLQEQIDTTNNFAKAIFTIVNKHNPNITEEQFNENLKNATSDSTVHTDYSFESCSVLDMPEYGMRENLF